MGKSKRTAILLSIFLGLFGADRFYLGYTTLGVLKLLTAGGFGIWALIDICLITMGILKPKNGDYDENASGGVKGKKPDYLPYVEYPPGDADIIAQLIHLLVGAKIKVRNDIYTNPSRLGRIYFEKKDEQKAIDLLKKFHYYKILHDNEYQTWDEFNDSNTE